MGKIIRRVDFLKDIFDTKLVLSLRGSHITYSPLSNEKARQKIMLPIFQK